MNGLASAKEGESLFLAGIDIFCHVKKIYCRHIKPLHAFSTMATRGFSDLPEPTQAQSLSPCACSESCTTAVFPGANCTAEIILNHIEMELHLYLISVLPSELELNL